MKSKRRLRVSSRRDLLVIAIGFAGLALTSILAKNPIANLIEYWLTPTEKLAPSGDEMLGKIKLGWPGFQTTTGKPVICYFSHHYNVVDGSTYDATYDEWLVLILSEDLGSIEQRSPDFFRCTQEGQLGEKASMNDFKFVAVENVIFEADGVTDQTKILETAKKWLPEINQLKKEFD